MRAAWPKRKRAEQWRRVEENVWSMPDCSVQPWTHGRTLISPLRLTLHTQTILWMRLPLVTSRRRISSHDPLRP